VPELVVLNKSDLAEDDVVARLLRREPAAVVVSAHTGEGIELLQERIAQALPRPRETVRVVVPYGRGDLVSRTHVEGEIDSEEHTERGTVLHARVGADLAAELRAAEVD